MEIIFSVYIGKSCSLQCFLGYVVNLSPYSNLQNRDKYLYGLSPVFSFYNVEYF